MNTKKEIKKLKKQIRYLQVAVLELQDIIFTEEVECKIDEKTKSVLTELFSHMIPVLYIEEDDFDL